MAQDKRRKRDISSDRLLEVSAHLFREQGYIATCVREIAKAAAMKTGSIYYHYRRSRQGSSRRGSSVA